MSDIYLQITETPTVVTLSAPVVSGALAATVTVANVVSVNVVTMPAITVQAAAPSVTTVAGTVTIGSCVTHGVNVANSVTISSLPAISGTVEVNEVQSVLRIYDGEGSVFGLDRTFPINGTVDVTSLPNLNSVTIGVRGTVTANIGNSITVGSLPVQLSTTTIGGTARLNVTLSSATTVGATAPSYGNLYGGSDGTNLRAILVDSSGRTTVTGSVSILGTPSVTMGAISGTVTANISGTSTVTGSVSILGTPSVTMGAISGTVTANNPNGTLTTRFGSVVTANSVLATTAVTNTSRKYLLVQNNQTGTSAGTVTIGIGFTPTTTQGIQLISGASYTADSFVPTGAVYWLGSVTGATFTILEG
jgi:hypothetical protein